MMYSYYALSLLKIPCPWKRYLTLAQLAQFSAVVVYSTICSVLWTYSSSTTVGWKPYAAVGVQVWEMVSLFVLFSLFYKKSYGTNAKKHQPRKDATSTMDSCSDALEAVAKDAQGVVANASKGAQKVVSNACMTASGQSVRNATNTPSWSIIH